MPRNWRSWWGWSLTTRAGAVGGGLPRRELDRADERWMRRALEVAGTTPSADVPVGAVIVGPDGEEFATGTNRREADADPLAHAEVVAIRSAVARAADGWRLEDCTLYVTLEPCAMCAGAIVGARMGRIVFGAWEPNTGACGSVWDIPRESPLHWVETRGGVLEAECQELLRGFFDRVRLGRE